MAPTGLTAFPGLISNEYIEIAYEVIQWARAEMVQRKPQMRRHEKSPAEGEPVCPFVKDSLDKRKFFFAFHPEVTGPGCAEQIVNVMFSYIDRFRAVAGESLESRIDTSFLIVFNRLEVANHGVLDAAHTEAKNGFVRSGMMLAQFYPGSEGTSKRNPALFVYRTPYALMAIRSMAVHDILFLHDNPEWFRIWDAQFGEDFKEPARVSPRDKPLLDLYTKAKGQFG